MDGVVTDTARWNVLAPLIMLIFIGRTLWTMASLNYRRM